jgi:hypothetical protein
LPDNDAADAGDAVVKVRKMQLMVKAANNRAAFLVVDQVIDVQPMVRLPWVGSIDVMEKYGKCIEV